MALAPRAPWTSSLAGHPAKPERLVNGQRGVWFVRKPLATEDATPMPEPLRCTGDTARRTASRFRRTFVSSRGSTALAGCEAGHANAENLCQKNEIQQ